MSFSNKMIAARIMYAAICSALVFVLPACSGQKKELSYFPLPEGHREIIRSEVQAFSVDTVVSGLVRPWSMVFMPGGDVLIAERSGKLQLVRNGKLQKDSISGDIPVSMRDIKLHPDYEKNGWIYISYYIEPTETDGGYTALLRGKIVNDRFVERQDLYKNGPYKENGEWYGSKIAFDKEGYLYYTIGIRGERMNAQDLSNSSGKTMRFHDDGTIPDDNPFVNTPGALPEIYTYGHRMHEGLVFDPKSGKLWSNEFGELGGDEVNILKAGANYGWPLVTFSLEYSGERISADSVKKGFEPPVHHWKNAPSDLVFVHGDRYPRWDGNLFIGGLYRKLLMRVVLDDHNQVMHDEVLLENIGRIRDVKHAPDGYLYVLTEDTGLLVRLLPEPEK